MDDSRSNALEAYEKLRRQLGQPPSSREFYREFPRRKLESAFPEGNPYSNLQKLAGDNPNAFSSPKSNFETILRKWGSLSVETLKEFGRLPIQADWRRKDIRPSISGIEKSHRIKWSELPNAFVEHYRDSAEWAAVLARIPVRETEPELVAKAEQCFVYLMRDLRNNMYKIGISRMPNQRERTLQSEQPKTELVAAKRYVNRKIASSIEKALHETYSHKRARGEWFCLDEEDVRELRCTLGNDGVA